MSKSARTFYVYEHWRPDIEKCFYVGKGHGARAKSFSRNDHHRNVVNKLRRAGLAPELRIVRDGLSEDEAFALERHLIASYGRADIGNGSLTNKSDGGDGPSGAIASTALRAARSARMKGNKLRRGLSNSPEARAKISAALKGNSRAVGHIHTEKVRAKISAANKGRAMPPEHYAALAEKFRGIPLSPATCEKLSIARKGKILSPEHRAKISASKKGVKKSPETRAKMSAARRARRSRSAPEGAVA